MKDNPVLNFNVFTFERWIYIGEIIAAKQIDGFERYIIDTNGIVYDTKRGNVQICQWVDTVGYYQCILRDTNGKRHYTRVHRLVAKTFIDNPN